MDNTNKQRYADNRSNSQTMKKSQFSLPVVAITSGDPNGIGYEVLLKTIADPHICEICVPIVYGSLSVARKYVEMLGEEYADMQFNLIRNAGEAKQGCINIINCYSEEFNLTPGLSTQEGGVASFAALERASEDLKSGVANVLVTAPINKSNIQSDSFRFSGHTEYLTSKFGKSGESLMMMVSDMMRVALVCNHVPVSEVASSITKERVLAKLKLLSETLQNDFIIRAPRIAVLALNPHAGDGGLTGKEESEEIIPAIAQSNEQGILAFGPYSADGFFGAGRYTHFDAILAMYHDQGLIPFKSLEMDGVNYTAGLPVIRTSPDHGTAYDLVGKNKASNISFAHSLYMALDLLKARNLSREINSNPLRKQHEENEMPEQPVQYVNPVQPVSPSV